MRVLIGAIVVAALGWSTYWWVGANRVETGVREWLDARTDAGWVANYSDVATGGFPNRHDTTISDPELADPATGVAWSGAFLQLLQLSYQPNHVIIAFPPTQIFATPDQRITLISESAQASLVLSPSAELDLNRSSFVFKDIKLDSTAGWHAEIAQGLFATRPSSETPGAIDVGFDAKDIRPAHIALAQLAKAGVVHGTLEHIKVDATVTFDAPWNLKAVEDQRPQVRALELSLLQLRWGHLEIWAAGDLSFDDLGRATGSITVKAKNWKEMLDLAVASGWIPDAAKSTLEGGLSLLAGLSGPATTLDAPLRFKDGAMSFGPVPLGSFPPFIIR